MNLDEAMKLDLDNYLAHDHPDIASGKFKITPRTELQTAQHLSNLLARIHRDDGHYETEHGITKAVADADIKVAQAYRDLYEATNRIGDLESALKSISEALEAHGPPLLHYEKQYQDAIEFATKILKEMKND